MLKQARQGRVRSIDGRMTAHILGSRLTGKKTVERVYALLKRVLPELVGADCPLFELNLALVSLNGAWASVLNGAAVCSTVLRTLDLHGCELRGPLPQLRLPALQKLDLRANLFTGSLEPIRECAALQYLNLSDSHLSGSLQPLRGCTALLELDVSRNIGARRVPDRLTGDLEPLRGCTALRLLKLNHNKLEGGLEPLQNCTAGRYRRCHWPTTFSADQLGQAILSRSGAAWLCRIST